MNNEDELNFSLNFESKKLEVFYHSNSENKTKLTVSKVQQLLVEKNFSDLFISIPLLTQFVRHCNEHSTEPFQLEIGEIKDASCDISISSDLMIATLTVYPAFRGRLLTVSDVHYALEQYGVSYGIVSNQEIDRILEESRSEMDKDPIDRVELSFVIATGLHPIDCFDAKFESLVPTIVERPEINEEDTVSFREFGSIVIVQEGQPVMQRIPASVGQVGYDVFGTLLDCYNGVNLSFSSRPCEGGFNDKVQG